MVSLLVEIPHSDLTKVTRMVLVHIRSVVMLTTSKTSTTGMLAVLAYTAVSSRDMAATVKKLLASQYFESHRPCQCSTTIRHSATCIGEERARETYCLRVFDKWVGIVVRCECRGWSSKVVLASTDLKFPKMKVRTSPRSALAGIGFASKWSRDRSESRRFINQRNKDLYVIHLSQQRSKGSLGFQPICPVRLEIMTLNAKRGLDL